MKHSPAVIQFIRHALNLLLRGSFILVLIRRNRLVRLLLVAPPRFLRYRGYLPLNHDGKMDST